MAVKKAPKAQTKETVGAVKAYDILQKRQISEDRILGERTSMFLLATSFLFLAFVTLLNPEWEGYIFTVLRYMLPIVGIFLTILLFFFNQFAAIALEFWHKAQCKIEKEAEEFAYMRSKQLTPHIAGYEFMTGEKAWVKCKENNDEICVLELVEKRSQKDQNKDKSNAPKPRHWWQKRLFSNSIIYRYCLPPAFFVLWATSLVFVIVS